MDGILIANELIDSRIRSRKEGLILKIDLEKAYNHVDWDCLGYMLFRFGFGDRWCSSIKECIFSASFSVLVNGSPSRQFKASRSIRQGDPLSPFLFTIVAEALGALLVQAPDIGLVKGFEAVHNGETISHLQFMDSTVLFLFSN